MKVCVLRRSQFLILFFIATVFYTFSLKSLKAQEVLKEQDNFIQNNERFAPKDSLKPISLALVIEQGMRENHSQKVRHMEGEIIDLDLESVKGAFWFPEVKLALSTEKQRLSRLHRGGKSPSNTPTSTTGSLGLTFGEFTVFNWGKDYLNYLNQRDALKRNKANLELNKKFHRHTLIKQYFYLIQKKLSEKIRKEYLSFASYVYRLCTEKLNQGAISRQEYLQARSLYLLAQQNYHNATLESSLADEAMATMINDPAGSRYAISEDLNFIELKMTQDEIQGQAILDNAPVLTAKTQLEISERAYELARKENLPLPKLTIDLGAYTHRFGPAQGGLHYETTPGSSDLEIVATLNATWDILGDDGFLNGRKLERAYLTHQLAQKNLENTKRNTMADIGQHFSKIQSEQKRILILQSRIETLQKTFDATMDNYLNKKTSFINFSEALGQWSTAQEELNLSKWEHLNSKLFLAQAMGLEDFPGENFDKLAIKNEKITGEKK